MLQCSDRTSNVPDNGRVRFFLSRHVMPMPDLPALPMLPPGRYRHFKGGLYEVLDVVRSSETLQPMVLYRALYGEGGLWVRPHAMFVEHIATADGKRPRFARVED